MGVWGGEGEGQGGLDWSAEVRPPQLPDSVTLRLHTLPVGLSFPAC